MPLTRKEFAGAAPPTTLASGINDSDTALTLTSGTGYPTGASYPFVLTIDPGTASEEKLLCSARAGAAVTVTTRGYDSTTAVAHSSGAAIVHTIDATVMSELVARAYDPDDSTIAVDGQTIQVKDGGVDTDQLADNAVTEAKIANGSVTEDKLSFTVESGAKIATGTYTGNGGTDRTIALSFTPTLVFIEYVTNATYAISAIGASGSLGVRTTSGTDMVGTAVNNQRPIPTTNGFIVSGSAGGELNINAAVYRYVAFGL